MGGKVIPFCIQLERQHSTVETTPFNPIHLTSEKGRDDTQVFCYQPVVHVIGQVT